MPDSQPKEITRRGFITKVGQGLVAANLAGTLLKSAAALEVPDPPGKKLGWAIVGLGSLAINQILPAFAKCEKSKVVALVSGHPDKASKQALRYGVDPKNIYNYENFDSIKDNPEVDVVYIVLPNSMHAEYTSPRFQAGKHVLSRKTDGDHVADCQADDRCLRCKAKRKLMMAYRCITNLDNLEGDPLARSADQSGRSSRSSAEGGFSIGDPTQWRLNHKRLLEAVR